MTYSTTKTITDNNIDFVRAQIERKNNLNTPAYATYCSVSQCITDMDNFPYNRFYRGVTTSSEPIIMEREAGFREVKNYAYYPNILKGEDKSTEPYVCFQPPCTTIYPCRTTDETKEKELKRPCTINISP